MSKRLRTRVELVPFLKARGFDTTFSCLEAACAPTLGGISLPVARIGGQGRAYMYDGDEVVAFLQRHPDAAAEIAPTKVWRLDPTDPRRRKRQRAASPRKAVRRGRPQPQGPLRAAA
jgi:hypothetical protein